MKAEDYKQFANALGVLCEIHGKELSPLAIQVYFKALEKYSIEEVEASFSNAFVKCKFFPKPVELIELTTGGPENLEDVALVEAHKIVSHLNQHGAIKWPALDDPITNHLMTRRWYYPKWAGEVLESELKWWVREFCEAYRAFSETDAPLQLEIPEEVQPLLENIGESF